MDRTLLTGSPKEFWLIPSSYGITSVLPQSQNLVLFHRSVLTNCYLLSSMPLCSLWSSRVFVWCEKLSASSIMHGSVAQRASPRRVFEDPVLHTGPFMKLSKYWMMTDSHYQAIKVYGSFKAIISPIVASLCRILQRDSLIGAASDSVTHLPLLSKLLPVNCAFPWSPTIHAWHSLRG